MAEEMKKLQRINELRNTVNELKAEKDRLSGRIETQEATLRDLEKKCKEEFDCEIDGLEDLASELEKEADANLQKAEKLLEVETVK